MPVRLQAVLDEMPALVELVDRLRVCGHIFGENTLGFGVQHLMPQTLGLCWALNELGLGYDRIALCGKPYSTNREVLEALFGLGVLAGPARTYDLRKSQTEELVEDLDWLATGFAERKAKHKNPTVIVIDDGGHALTRLDRFVAPPCAVAGVEQTASGFWQVGVRSVPFPIVDVGASAVKRVCEPALIVEAALSRAFEYLTDRRSQVCGIAGMGFIGEALGAALSDQGLSVTVYDVRPDTALPTMARRARSLRELFNNCDLIFGCSGTDVTEDFVAGRGTEPLKSGRRTLISLSSGDVEFFALKALLLAEKEAASCTYGLDAIPNVSGDFEGASFEIVKNGFPVNFDNASQSVPLRKIQGTVAALVGAAAQAYSLASQNRTISQPSRVMLDRSLQAWLYRKWQPLLGQNTDDQFGEHIVSLSTFRTDPSSVDLGSSFPGCGLTDAA